MILFLNNYININNNEGFLNNFYSFFCILCYFVYYRVFKRFDFYDYVFYYRKVLIDNSIFFLLVFFYVDNEVVGRFINFVLS